MFFLLYSFFQEMQSQMNMFQNQKQLPDLSELMSNIFPGDAKKQRKGVSSSNVLDKGGVKKAGKRR